jgi:DNA-directed RNA polymerase specialized sigma24 family protein
VESLVLEDVWSQLSPDSRRLLGHFFAGYSYGEIADLTGQSVSAVASKVWRARQLARELAG